MKLEKKKISWGEIAGLQRAGVPPHIVLVTGRCENCRRGHCENRSHLCENCLHSLSAHYDRTHGMTRVACSGGKCLCTGIKIQGKLIDEFKIASEAS